MNILVGFLMIIAGAFFICMGALTMDEEWMKTHPQVTRLWESTGTTTVSNPKYRVNGVLESIDNEMVVWLDYSGKVIKFTAKKPEPKTTQ